MAEQLPAIKSRIRSVTTTHQITKAMKLVSSVKVTRWKSKMLSNRDYIDELEKISSTLLSSCVKVDTPYMQENREAEGDLYLLITSSLGLCGSYNSNLFKFTDNVVTPRDTLIILGAKGISHYSGSELNINLDFAGYTTVDDESMVKQLSNYLIDSFREGKYRSVKIIYTHFRNSISFNPQLFTLLPLESEGTPNPDLIVEPNKNQIIERIIPMYLMSAIHTKLLEAELSEHASRTQAMDNATSNAEDLLDELNLDFNKARQQKITEEITEIVAASKDKQ